MSSAFEKFCQASSAPRCDVPPSITQSLKANRAFPKTSQALDIQDTTVQIVSLVVCICMRKWLARIHRRLLLNISLVNFIEPNKVLTLDQVSTIASTPPRGNLLSWIGRRWKSKLASRRLRSGSRVRTSLETQGGGREIVPGETPPSERLRIEARTMGGRDVEVEVEVEKVVSAERSGVERIRYGAKRSGREVEVDG